MYISNFSFVRIHQFCSLHPSLVGNEEMKFHSIRFDWSNRWRITSALELATAWQGWEIKHEGYTYPFLIARC